MTLTGNLISQVVGHSFGLNAEKLIHWLEERCTDHSQALSVALAHANDCAWHAIGLALCGASFFDRFKDVLRNRDLTAIHDEIRGFLVVTPTGLEDSPPAVRTVQTRVTGP